MRRLLADPFSRHLILAGLIALQRIPVQLTPNVEDTIIAVTTRWEGANPQEIEKQGNAR